MKLIKEPNANDVLNAFMKVHSTELKTLSSEKRSLLKYFYDLRFLEQSGVKYENKQLKLMGWPDLSQVNVTPMICELCARLVLNSAIYEDLLQSGN